MSAPTYKERVAADRRLLILRLLDDQPGYTINSSILQTALEDWGYNVSRVALQSDLDHLAETDTVELRELAGGVRVAKLTERGADVVSGRARIQGIARPSP